MNYSETDVKEMLANMCDLYEEERNMPYNIQVWYNAYLDERAKMQTEKVMKIIDGLSFSEKRLMQNILNHN